MLSANEKKLVEENMSIVPKIIFSCIGLNENVTGLGYGDLYQDGCVALCKAAQTYTGQVAFSTYAGTVIRNYLISRCRAAVSRNFHEAPPGDLDEWQTSLDGLEDCEEFEGSFERAIRILVEMKSRYVGAERQGIDALCWRIAGYTCDEIGKRWGVSERLISRRMAQAKEKLKNDPEFLGTLG